MSSSALRLRTIMNDPSSLNMSKEWIALDNHTPPTLLIYGESLTNAVLRSANIATYNLVAYWKTVTKAPPPGFPAIESHFDESPFLLQGTPHRTARKTLTPPYRSVEIELTHWLPTFTESFFTSYQTDQATRPIPLALSYIDGVFKEILAREAACSIQEIPLLPSGLFSFLPRLASVLEFDRRLEAVVQTLEAHLTKAGKSAHEAMALSTIVVMGQQPLLGAFVYGLLNPPPNGGTWEGESLMRQSSPVSVLGREVHTECNINGLQLAQGQPLHICPFLSHMHSDAHAKHNASSKSLAFGAGPHVCSGRKITLEITNAFFKQWVRTKHIQLDTSGIKLTRDLLLVPQEKS